MPVVLKKNQNPQQAAGWKKWSHDYRQPLGETATIALAEGLAEQGEVQCRVETAVDAPDEVFDRLAEHGWAYPTFYA